MNIENQRTTRNKAKQNPNYEHCALQKQGHKVISVALNTQIRETIIMNPQPNSSKAVSAEPSHFSPDVSSVSHANSSYVVVDSHRDDDGASQAQPSSLPSFPLSTSASVTFSHPNDVGSRTQPHAGPSSSGYDRSQVNNVPSDSLAGPSFLNMGRTHSQRKGNYLHFNKQTSDHIPWRDTTITSSATMRTTHQSIPIVNESRAPTYTSSSAVLAGETIQVGELTLSKHWLHVAINQLPQLLLTSNNNSTPPSAPTSSGGNNLFGQSKLPTSTSFDTSPIEHVYTQTAPCQNVNTAGSFESHFTSSSVYNSQGINSSGIHSSDDMFLNAPIHLASQAFNEQMNRNANTPCGQAQMRRDSAFAFPPENIPTSNANPPFTPSAFLSQSRDRDFRAVMRNIDPPRFRGKNDRTSPFEYIEEIVKFQKLARLTDAEMLSTVLPYVLKNEADRWWKMEQQLNPIYTMAEFVLRFRKNFQSQTYHEELKHEFESRWQGPNETMCEFISRILDYCRKLCITVPESVLVHHILSRINPTYVPYFQNAQSYFSLRELKQSAEEVDARVCRMKLYRPPSDSYVEFQSRNSDSNYYDRSRSTYRENSSRDSYYSYRRSPSPYGNRHYSFRSPSPGASYQSNHYAKPNGTYSSERGSDRSDRDTRHVSFNFHNKESYGSTRPNPSSHSPEKGYSVPTQAKPIIRSVTPPNTGRDSSHVDSRGRSPERRPIPSPNLSRSDSRDRSRSPNSIPSHIKCFKCGENHYAPDCSKKESKN